MKVQVLKLYVESACKLAFRMVPPHACFPESINLTIQTLFAEMISRGKGAEHM